MRIDEALSTLRSIADRLHASGCHWRSERITESADAIEAAMREKDAEIEQWRTTSQNLLEQMLDEMKQNGMLRALLAEARDDIRESVENEYPPDLRRYPAEMRRYQAGMDIVHRITDALGEPLIQETKP